MSEQVAEDLVVEEVVTRSGPGYEAIAVRAYEIHLSGEGGDDIANWLRAEAELHAEQSQHTPGNDRGDTDA